MKSKYTLSLIIPTKNRKDDLTKCLKSIVNQKRNPDEVIIVDDNSNYDITSIVEQIFKDIIVYKIIKNDITLGISKCRNLGINKSNGDIIFFLDDDCEILEDYIWEIEKIYINDKEEKIGGVEGLIIGNYQEKCWYKSLINKIFMLDRTGAKGDILLSGLSIVCNEENMIVPTAILMGAASFRRSLFKTFKYNENFPGWSYDDHEFSYRVSKQYTLIHNPKAKMYHNCSQIERETNFHNYSKRIWMHYILWKNCVPINIISIICFIWADIGFILRTIFFQFRIRRTLGILHGHLILIKLCFKDIRNFFKTKLMSHF